MKPYLVEIAIEPISRTSFDDFEVALNRLAAEDVEGFGIATDRETGQTVIKGLSEQHLVRILDRLKSRFGIAAIVGAPQVAYRETLSRRSEIDYTHKKQSGGSGQFARIKLVFEPGEPGSGYHFESKIVGGSVPKEYIPGVEKGLEVSRDSGVLAGFPVIDYKVTLIDGAYHDVDSSVLAFEIAARAAFKEGLQKAQCKLLEPIMKVDVTAPNDCVATVVTDLKRRRADALSIEPCRIDALVPLANMFGYENTLREMTAKRGSFTVAFDRYAPVPSPDDDGPFAPAVGMRA
jgi:elongation factor G